MITQAHKAFGVSIGIGCKRVQGCKDATAAGNPCREEVGEALHHGLTVPCNCRHGLRGSGK